AVALEDAADLLVDFADVDGLTGTLQATPETPELRADVLCRALVHRVLLGFAFARAAQEETLDAVWAETLLHLEPVPHVSPASTCGELACPALHLRARRAHEVAPSSFAQPFEVVLARHPAVHHPDAPCLAVESLHLFDDLLDRGDVDAVAVEDLVAERVAL